MFLCLFYVQRPRDRQRAHRQSFVHADSVSQISTPKTAIVCTEIVTCIGLDKRLNRMLHKLADKIQKLIGAS